MKALERWERFEKEAKLERTEARQRKDAVRKERLAPGPWDADAFSPPGESGRCEHKFLQKMVLGGQPEYWCDDCETEIVLPSGFYRPKQHVSAVALQKLLWCMKHLGPKAVAVGLLRPHARYDLPGSPELAPIALLEEYQGELRELSGYLDEFKQLALENGHRPELPEPDDAKT